MTNFKTRKTVFTADMRKIEEHLMGQSLRGVNIIPVPGVTV